MTRHLIPACWALLFVSTFGNVAAQSTDFDVDRTTALLASNKISELREAHAIVRAHPRESMVLLDVVAARAEHPELASILKTMFQVLPADRLKSQIANDRSTKTRLAASELKSRGESAQLPSSTPRQIPMPAPPIRSTDSPTPVRTPRSATQTNDAISLRSIQEKQSQKRPLRESEIVFLFEELDAEFNSQDRDQRRYRSDVLKLLEKNRPAAKAIARVRLFDDSVKYPERLCDHLLDSLINDSEVRERVYALTLSGDDEQASLAINSFGKLKQANSRNTEIVNEIITRFLDRSSENIRVRASINGLLTSFSDRASATIQAKIRQRFVESILHPDSMRNSYLRSGSVGNLLEVTRRLADDERKQIADSIAARFDEAEEPMQATYAMLSLDADMTGMQPVFRELLKTSERAEFRPLYAQALYRAGDQSESVINVFREALSSPSLPGNFRNVHECMHELGADAAPLLPIVLKLLEDPKYHQREVIKAIGGMGEAAEDAVPKLIELMAPKGNSSLIQREVITALGEIGPAAKSALPRLREIAIDGDENYLRVTFDAIAKILNADPTAIDYLTDLSLSAKTPRAGWYASATAEKVRRTTMTVEQLRNRYVDHGEYVEDTATGLLWQKDGDASSRKNFVQATQYAEELSLAEMTNWRLPKGYELASIFPATEKPFVDTSYTETESRSWYWSSHALERPSSDYAYIGSWCGNGYLTGCIASRTMAFVRCVHDPSKANAR
ncbi:MAG: DUF1566 domain-containing protein [Rubripirellula sp.]